MLAGPLFLAVIPSGFQSDAPVDPTSEAYAAPGDDRGGSAGGRWTWEDFPVFVWRQRHGGRELPEELIAPFGGTNVFRDEEAAWVRDKGYAFYVTNAAGRNDLHLDADEEWEEQVRAWSDSRAPELLARKPCLTAPETRARLFATLERTLAARGGDHGFGLSLGDEVGLTPHDAPFDFCRSETCESRWRAWASERGWPEEAPTTDDVRHALADGDHGPVGPWLARRRFHREVVSGLIRELAERAGDVDVGLLGIGADSPFAAVDLALFEGERALDFAELYPVVDARERWRGLRSPTHVLGTVFLQEASPDEVAWQAWEHWLQGASGLVIWSDAYLEDRPDVRERLADVVRRIRELHRRFPRPEPWLDPPVIVHDEDSVAAAWLRDALLDGPTWIERRPSHQREHGSFEARVTRWIQVLEDHDLAYRVLDLEEAMGLFEAGRSTPLILPSVLVVDPEELERLERPLAEDLEERGDGVAPEPLLVVDGPMAWVDSRGTPWPEDVLERLERAYPGRVLRAPPSLRRYGERRRRGASADVTRLLTELLHGFDAEQEPARLAGRDSSWPFLIRRRVGAGPGAARDRLEVLLAGLPNASPRPAGEGALERTRVVVRLDGEGRGVEGSGIDSRDVERIEWLQPESEEAFLPPGEPALLRVTYGRPVRRDR